MAVFYEPAFGLDSFGKPLVYEDWQAVARSIIIVLLGKPGFYPSIPQLGMHIQDLLYERLDDIDGLIQDVINSVNDNQANIYNTLLKKLD